MLLTIYSGGQTGADRAALDVARVWDLPIGGWIPRGRKAEDGIIPVDLSELRETETEESKERTRRNVLDTDGTAIFSHGPLTGGSALTLEFALDLRKPVLHLDLYKVPAHSAVTLLLCWLRENTIEKLNVAGPPASIDPAAYNGVFAVVSGVIALLHEPTFLAPSPNLDNSVASVAVPELLANFRHWDQLRWQVPSWYIALTAALMTIGSIFDKGAGASAVKYAALILGVFGCFCLMLQCNLVRYHNRATLTLNRILRQNFSRKQIARLRDGLLPFEFSGRRIWCTATLWFSCLMFLITVLCFYTFATGPRWIGKH